MGQFEIVPIPLKLANAFVDAHHRHHGSTRGHKFSLGLRRRGAGELVGVAIAGRPVSRRLDDGLTLEVTRLATDGTRNACSALYAAVRRAAAALGYRKVITYTLASEPGASLRASGWLEDGKTRGESWDRPGRSRADRHPTIPKTRWVAQ